MTEAIFKYLDNMIQGGALDDFLDRRLVTRAEWADKFAQEEYFDLWGEHHDPLEIVQKDKLILILGEAGSGKTTLLRYISNHQANSCLETLKIKGQVTFPIYVNFSRFKEGDLLDYFKTTLPPDIFSLLQKRPTDFKSWRFIYLLDGLDEIPLDNIPDRLRSIFSNSMSFKAASDLVILSSRPIFYESYRSTFELWPIQVYHLARLTWEQISSYCKQKGCEPKELFKESARLDFDEFLRNPLNLKLALDLLKTEGQLPSTKSNLFERIVQWKTVLQCSYEDEETLTVALGIFKPHIEVDAIRPDVDVVFPERSLFVHSRYSVSQTLFKRTMFVAERPGVWGPRSASSAGIMSPVEIPFR